MKHVITFTDRNYYRELDLRKDKLGTPSIIALFEVNDDNEVVRYDTTAMYYNLSSKIKTLRKFAEGRLSKNRHGEQNTFHEKGISPKTYAKFLKFAGKHGKVVEPADVEEVKDYVNGLLKTHAEAIEVVWKKRQELLQSMRKLDIRTSKGQWRKISYKNILIEVDSNSYRGKRQFISGPDTNLYYLIKDSGDIYDSRLENYRENYYAFYHFVGNNESVEVFRSTEKVLSQYVELQKRLDEINKEFNGSILKSFREKI